MRAGRSVEAEKLLRDLLPIEERAYGTSFHPTVAFAHHTLGQLAESHGNLAEAETEYGRSIEIDQKLFGASDYKTAVSTSYLAGILVKEGRYGEAERIVRPAVTALTARPLPGNMNVGFAQLNLGEAVLKQKRYQEAVEPLTAAYEILKTGSGVPKGRLEQAGAEADAGDGEAAVSGPPALRPAGTNVGRRATTAEAGGRGRLLLGVGGGAARAAHLAAGCACRRARHGAYLAGGRADRCARHGP